MLFGSRDAGHVLHKSRVTQDVQIDNIALCKLERVQKRKYLLYVNLINNL